MDGHAGGKDLRSCYGEFSTLDPCGDLEAVSLASPTDRRPDPATRRIRARCRPSVRAVPSRPQPDFPTPNVQSSQRRRWIPLGVPPRLSKGVPSPAKSQSQMRGTWARLATSLYVRIGCPRIRLLRSPRTSSTCGCCIQRVIDVDLARMAFLGRTSFRSRASRRRRRGAWRCAALERFWGAQPATASTRRAVDGRRAHAVCARRAYAEHLPTVDGRPRPLLKQAWLTARPLGLRSTDASAPFGRRVALRPSRWSTSSIT